MTDAAIPVHVQQIKDALRPELLTLVQRLPERSEHLSFAFFMELLGMLDEARSEEDLIGWVVHLSTCAFIGLDYGPESHLEIDAFLALAEQISQTMAGAPGPQH